MNDNTKNNLFPDYSDDDLGLFVFDGFEGYYEQVAQIIEEKGFLGMKDYKVIHLLFIRLNEWQQHIRQIRDNPDYSMTWHIDENKEGRGFTQKVKRFCNGILIDETSNYICIMGSLFEESTKEEICQEMIKEGSIEEVIKEAENFYHFYGFQEKREQGLMKMYSSLYDVTDLFSYLVDINGVEWVDFILNDAKMDYIEMSHQWDKKDSDMLVYLDLCAEKARLMSDNMIPQQKTEYESNEELLRIFLGDKSKMQKFLKNIQGLSGAAIVHRVKVAIEQNMIYADDAQTPLYNALKALGYPVTSLQNWNKAFYSKKKSPVC